jgi:hypothetical protein
MADKSIRKVKSSVLRSFLGSRSNPGPLGEVQDNQQDRVARSPKKVGRGRTMTETEPRQSAESLDKRQRDKIPPIYAQFCGTTEPSPTTRSVPTTDSMQTTPGDIDQQLEALLDRRNIPENQRYKMRDLSHTIKLEFIRQDWAEVRDEAELLANKQVRAEAEAEATVCEQHEEREGRPKHARGHSFTTLLRGKSRDRSEKKKDRSKSTVGRHFRSKSTDSIADSVASERPSSSANSSSPSLLPKVGQMTPTDFVRYLQKVQKPELVEVGKLHKLRLLLRNETVAWAEDFIHKGGMKEVVDLLQRIMNVEWR